MVSGSGRDGDNGCDYDNGRNNDNDGSGDGQLQQWQQAATAAIARDYGKLPRQAATVMAESGHGYINVSNKVGIGDERRWLRR